MAISNELKNLVDPNNECCCEHCLSNLVKEWAFNEKNCKIHSGKHEIGEGSKIGYECNVNERHSQIFLGITIAGTETEAIFKAGEWILKELSK